MSSKADYFGLFFNSPGSKTSVLVLPEIGAAFDTTVDKVSIDRLVNWTRFSVALLNLIQFYLTDEDYFVSFVYVSAWTKIT